MQAWVSGDAGPFPGRPRADRREIRAQGGLFAAENSSPATWGLGTFLSSGELHMRPGQDSALIQEVAKPKAFQQLFGADRAVRTDFEVRSENPKVGHFGIDQ